MGLLHLTNALAVLGTGFRQEVGPDFPFALASLSCTAMLCRYLGLNRTLVVPGVEEHRATPAVLSSVLKLQVNARGARGRDVLAALHVSLLRHLAMRWKRIPPSEVKIMSFNVALRASYTQLHLSLHSAPKPWQLDEVTTCLESDEAEDRDVSVMWSFGPSTVVAFLWLLALQLGCASRDHVQKSAVE